MKQYLEIIENLSENELLTKQPQMLRLEVNSKEDAQIKLDENITLFNGINCIKRIHTCYHEEGKSCKVDELSITSLEIKSK